MPVRSVTLYWSDPQGLQIYHYLTIKIGSKQFKNTIKLSLPTLIGIASNPDILKIWLNGIFFENRLNWQFEVQLLLFIVCTCI